MTYGSVKLIRYCADSKMELYYSVRFSGFLWVMIAIGTYQEYEHDQVHTVQDQHRTVAQ